MPRMAGLALHDSPAYQRYLEGELGNPGTVKRWSGLRPFERDEQGRIILPLGERFCRMPHRGGDGIQLCSKDGLFSGYANLKVHIRLVHKEVIAPAHKGGSSQAEIDDASNYYTLLVARLTGADDGQTEIITPRKASAKHRVQIRASLSVGGRVLSQMDFSQAKFDIHGLNIILELASVAQG